MVNTVVVEEGVKDTVEKIRIKGNGAPCAMAMKCAPARRTHPCFENFVTSRTSACEQGSKTLGTLRGRRRNSIGLALGSRRSTLTRDTSHLREVFLYNRQPSPVTVRYLKFCAAA